MQKRCFSTSLLQNCALRNSQSLFLEFIVPALAGFQSEHEVEIPFMLTSEEDSETTARGPKKPRVGGVLDGSSNWKVPRDSFS